MRIMKANRFRLPLILLFAVSGLAQTESESNLRVVPSLFRQIGKSVRFAGRDPRHVSHYAPEIAYNGVTYYFSDDDLDGLVAEDGKSGKRVIYEPTELAIAAGWLKKGAGKKETSEGEEEEPVRNHLRGYYRAGDVIWMGTDGFGVLAFDTKRKVWTRYDTEASPRPGREMAGIFYADEDYVFATGFNVYSQKYRSWIKVDAIPTRYVRHFGYSGIYVQMPWSLTKYAQEKFLPLNVSPPLFMLQWPDKATLRDDGEAYIFESGHDESLTEFIIEKWQLEWAFSQVELKSAPQQSK
jgi:hypothetical protein